MKRLLFAVIVAALAAPDASACLAGRARARQVSRVRTVQTTCVKQAPAVSYVPQTRVVETTVMKPVTVMVPTKVHSTVTEMVPVIKAAPAPVVTSRTTERVRGREVVRGALAAPVRIVGGVLQALPCPNCR